MDNNHPEPLIFYKKSEQIQIYQQAYFKGAITLYVLSFERKVNGKLIPLTPEQLSHLSYKSPHQKRRITLNKVLPGSIGLGCIPKIDYVQEVAFSDLLVKANDVNQLREALTPTSIENKTKGHPSGDERQKMWLKTAKEFHNLELSVSMLAEAIFKHLQQTNPSFITKENEKLIDVETIKRFLYLQRASNKI